MTAPALRSSTPILCGWIYPADKSLECDPYSTHPAGFAHGRCVEFHGATQLSRSMSLEVAYVGSKGTHGFAGNGPNYNYNPVAAGPGTSFIAAKDATTNKLGGFTAATPQDSRRPLCGTFDPVTKLCSGIGFDLGNYYGNDAASTYNAFEAKLDKRFTGGLQFLTHYTYAHANNYSDNYYAVSHKVAWGPVDFNRNHVWVLSTVYELPFGKGKRFAGGVSRAMDYAVGGWQLSKPPTGAVACHGRPVSVSAAPSLTVPAPAGPTRAPVPCILESVPLIPCTIAGPTSPRSLRSSTPMLTRLGRMCVVWREPPPALCSAGVRQHRQHRQERLSRPSRVLFRLVGFQGLRHH